MRYGFEPALAKRLERQNADAHLICEAVVTTSASIKETKDDWDGADALVDMTSLDDGGVKIAGSVTTHINQAVRTTDETDLDNASPWEVAEVVWNPIIELRNREINTLVANLTNRVNGGSPGEVTQWRAKLFRVVRISIEGAGNQIEVYELAPLGTARAAPGTYSTSPGDITFTFGLNGRGPVVGNAPFIADEDRGLLGAKFGSPRWIVRIDALKGEGVAAGNVGWSVDGNNQSLASGSDTVNRLTLTEVDNQESRQSFDAYTLSAEPNGVPKFALKANLFAQKTVAFTGGANDIDLGAAPGGSTKLRVVALGQKFSDSDLTYQLDDGGGMTTVVDADIIGEDNSGSGGTDLSGMNRQQAYDGQVILDPSTNTEITPIVRRFGVEEIDVTDLDGLVKIGETSHELDPIDLIGNVPEIALTLLRDGLRDYRDTATELLSDNFIKDLEFRIWVGHQDLDRKDWLHIDDFVIDSQESAGVGIRLRCVSPVALADTTVPIKSGGARAPLVYAAQTLKAVYEDLLTVQVNGFPTRRIGAMIEDATQVTKTIDGPIKGKLELNRLAYLAGGGLIASQGKLKFVDLMTDDSPAVAAFPSEMIKILSVSPGYQERIPDVYVGWGYNTTKADKFADESYASVANAITNLGRATLDRKEELDAEIAQWIINATFADVISARITENFATGLILIVFQSINPMPWIEPGDAVLVNTDKFVARDPHTGLAIRGQTWARCRIVACHDTFGTKFTAWVRSYADLIPTVATITRDAYASTPEITGIGVTFDEEAEAVVSVSGDRATANMYVTVGDGSAPSDPTVGSNDGTIAGRTGTVATGKKVTTGNDAFVKAVGANLNGDLGTVHSTRYIRELGPFHKDATSRTHTGDTNETTLATITIPANKLGANGGVRITASFKRAGGPAAGVNLRWKFGGTNIDQTSVSTSVTQVDYNFIVMNRGATNVQNAHGFLLALVVGHVSIQGTAAIDTTAAVDIIFTVELGNGADDAELEFTMVEYVGRN